MRNNPPLRPATRLAQALRFLDARTGAITPPIQPSATYARDEDYALRQAYWYKRDGNETTQHAEKIIADLEGAADSMLFTSGMSAASAIIAQLDQDAHVVIPRVMYHGVLNQFQIYQAQKRLRVSTYDAGDLQQLADAIIQGDSAIVWVETPNNPDWTVTDISAAADLAHRAGAKLVCDCTATPPCATRALELGADISFHSATKYLNGHSDISAGVLSISKTDDFWDQLELQRKLNGTVLGSFDAWLLIRGMRTLLLRYERATQNALQLAQHFQSHPRLAAVLYPGLPSHPSHTIAKAQTNGAYGGMLSVIVDGTQQHAIDVCRYVRLFYPATSLGGG